MKIAVSGASGFTGSALVRELVRREHEVIKISRDSFTLPPDEFTAKKIEGTDAIVHLAGSPIIRRWTVKGKREITDSRILTTRRIVEAIAQATVKPKVLISASAIGIYDSQNTHTEESRDFSDGFLSRVCRDWETETLRAEGLIRTVILRLGVVIGDGGMIARLRFPFSVGLGGTIGNGRQHFSFIHIDDLIAIILACMENTEMSGIYNAVAPWPTDNGHFTEVLGKVLMQPAIFRIPAFALKLMYGEAAVVLTEGQRVLPERLMQLNFPYKYPTIEKALLRTLR